MATRLLFESSKKSGVLSKLECFLNESNEIYIDIEHEESPPSWICLEKQDAIKLVKVLKTEINKMGV